MLEEPKGNPLVTVIIPTFNRVALLEEAVTSALVQTYAAVEVVIVDDGSTDSIWSVIEGVSNSNSGKDVRYYRQENRGPAAARNLGVAHARGRYIKFLDSDDTLSERDIEEFVGAIGRHGADLCIGSRRYMSPEGRQWSIQYAPPDGLIDDVLTRFFNLELRPQGALWFFDARICREYPWDEGLLAREDTDFLGRILIDGKVVCGAPKAIYNQRYHSLGRQMNRQFEPAVLANIVESNERLCTVMRERRTHRAARRAYASSLCRTALRLWSVDETVSKRFHRIAKSAFPVPELQLPDSYHWHLRAFAYILWLVGGPRVCGPLWNTYRKWKAR